MTAVARRRLADATKYVIAAAVATVAGALVIALMGGDVLSAYRSFLWSSLGTAGGFAQTLNKMCPLLLGGLAVGVARRAGYFNIGVDGQIYAGAIAATGVGAGARARDDARARRAGRRRRGDRRRTLRGHPRSTPRVVVRQRDLRDRDAQLRRRVPHRVPHHRAMERRDGRRGDHAAHSRCGDLADAVRARRLARRHLHRARDGGGRVAPHRAHPVGLRGPGARGQRPRGPRRRHSDGSDHVRGADCERRPCGAGRRDRGDGAPSSPHPRPDARLRRDGDPHRRPGQSRPAGILVVSFAMAVLLVGSDSLQRSIGLPASAALVFQALIVLSILFVDARRAVRPS